jgi:putative oxidoreductase
MFHAHHAPLQIAGQVLIGSLFVTQGLGALPRARFKFHSGRLGERRIPAPDFVLICGLAMMLAGGVMVMADIYSEVGAALLLVFGIVATVLFHNFWAVQDSAERRHKRAIFFNNLAVIGGLLLVLAFG